MIRQAIHQLVENRNLDFETTKAVMDEIMSGQTTQTQISFFLTALRMKGETIDEITVRVTVMRGKTTKLNPSFSVMDIVGTGEDEVGTFNISTTSAFVAAVGGIHVAKHGNRSVSSKGGVTDVLEYLGAKLALTAKQVEVVLEQTGMCFLFAPFYYLSVKYAASVRKEIGIRSISNILGPLFSPTGVSMQFSGVYSKELAQPLVQVLVGLGVKWDMVACGGGGLDGATLTGVTRVCEIRFGELFSYDIIPQELGLTACRLEELIGGTPQENALITRDILPDSLKGPKRDVVVIDVAISLYLGINDCTIRDCVKKAQEIIDSGATIEKMEESIQATVWADPEGKKEMAS